MNSFDRRVVVVLGVVHVDEQRPRQRRVLAGLGGLGRRLDAAVAVVDRQRLERVGVLLVVGVAEVAGRTLGAGDTLDQDVVVLGGLVVVAGGLGLVDRSRRRPCSRRCRSRCPGPNSEISWSGKLGSRSVPVGDLGAGGPQLDELVGGQAVDGEVGVDDDGERVGGDLELGVLDAALLAGRDLVLLDRTRGVGDVGLAGAEPLEPATGAGLADRDLDVRVLLGEQLAGGLRSSGRRSRSRRSSRCRWRRRHPRRHRRPRRCRHRTRQSARARAAMPGTIARRMEVLFTSFS